MASLLAAHFGHLATVKLLLETGGVDENAWDVDSFTPLIAAAKHSYTNVVEALLEKQGIDVNAQNDFGDTAVLWAAHGANEPMMNCSSKRVPTPIGRTCWGCCRGPSLQWRKTEYRPH